MYTAALKMDFVSVTSNDSKDSKEAARVLSTPTNIHLLKKKMIKTGHMTKLNTGRKDKMTMIELDWLISSPH